MIYNILLDAMIYNFTPLYSYFFLTNLKNISLKEFVFAIILLYFLTANLLLPIYMLVMYIVNKQIKLNSKRFHNNIFINLLNYFLFVITFSLVFNKSLFNTILLSFPVHIFYYLLSYIFLEKNIYLNR